MGSRRSTGNIERSTREIGPRAPRARPLHTAEPRARARALGETLQDLESHPHANLKHRPSSSWGARSRQVDVEQVVAQPALSVVYRATHRVWQRSVAIKAFTAPSLSDDARQQLLASFVEEGRLLMDLSERCASICQARDVSSLTTSRGDWVPYTVLEWLDGESLEELLRRERAPRAARLERSRPRSSS